MEIKRGEIYFADLGTGQVGSEQSGTRPVLIMQNNIGNRFAPTVIVACITSKLYKTHIPTHVQLDKNDYGFTDDSLILCEQIKTLDKQRLLSRVAALTPHDQVRVDKAVKLSLGLL